MKRTQGLTLLETVCVIGIILSLSAMLFPVFAEARRAAKQTTCLSNLRSAYTATLLYSNSYDDVAPLGKDCEDLRIPEAFPEPARTKVKAMPLLSELLYPYAKSREIWRCPLDTGTFTSDTKPVMEFNSSPSLFASCGMSYRFPTAMGLAGITFTTVSNNSNQFLYGDQAGHWHPNSMPLKKEYGDAGNLNLMPNLRYSVVFLDGHVEKSVTYYRARDTWMTP